MLTRDELPDCPVATTLMVMGGKWKMFVVQQLLTGPKRFGQLASAIAGISEKSLSETLRQMVGDGIVVRTEYPEVPRHVEYGLTELGESLRPILESMGEWGTRYQQAAR